MTAEKPNRAQQRQAVPSSLNKTKTAGVKTRQHSKLSSAEKKHLEGHIRRGNESEFKALIKKYSELSQDILLIDEKPAFHIACLYGNLELVEALAAHSDFNPTLWNSAAKYQNTPLHDAVRSSNPKLVKYLLEKEAIASINAQNKLGYTPLHTALTLQEKNPKIAELCLKKKDPNHSEEQRKLLENELSSAKAQELVNRLEIIKLLLEKKADVNIPCIQGNTALHLSRRNGYFYAAVWLLGAGANPSLRNESNKTPLQCSIRNIPENIYDLFEKAMAFYQELQATIEKGEYSKARALVQSWSQHNPKGTGIDSEAPLLHIAVKIQSLPIAKLLIQQDINNIYAINSDRKTALTCAEEANNKAMVHLLTEASKPICLDVSQEITPPDTNHPSVGEPAATDKAYDPFRETSATASPNPEEISQHPAGSTHHVLSPTAGGQSFFSATPSHYSEEITPLSFETATSLSTSAYSSFTDPLHSHCDNEGNTPLHIAAGKSSHHTAILLIKNRVNVNAVNLLGHTALDKAISVNAPDTVEYLLAAGAYTHRYDDQEKTLLDTLTSCNNVKEHANTLKIIYQLIKADINIFLDSPHDSALYANAVQRKNTLLDPIEKLLNKDIASKKECCAAHLYLILSHWREDLIRSHNALNSAFSEIAPTLADSWKILYKEALQKKWLQQLQDDLKDSQPREQRLSDLPIAFQNSKVDINTLLQNTSFNALSVLHLHQAPQASMPDTFQGVTDIFMKNWHNLVLAEYIKSTLPDFLKDSEVWDPSEVWKISSKIGLKHMLQQCWTGNLSHAAQSSYPGVESYQSTDVLTASEHAAIPG